MPGLRHLRGALPVRRHCAGLERRTAERASTARAGYWRSDPHPAGSAVNPRAPSSDGPHPVSTGVTVKVGVSGFFWNSQTTGSGQYTRQLLHALVAQRPDAKVRLFLPKAATHHDAQHAEPRQSSTSAARAGERSRPPAKELPSGTARVRTGADTWVRRVSRDSLGSNLAKLWFEQVVFPMACRFAQMDVAHVPYFAPPLQSQVPTVVTIHDLIPLLLPEYRGSIGVRAYMRLVSTAAKRTTLILTDSRSSASDIHRVLHIPPERIRVVYLAADSSYRPVDQAGQSALRVRLRLPERFILYLGGFDVRKNVSKLLAAYARARPRLGDTELVIAGTLPFEDTAFAPDPRRIADDLGIGEHVLFTGWVSEEDKPALYSAAAVFAFPSRYEGFGLPVLEALACGTPAVVGAGSSLEEVVGEGGLVVAPDDDAAIADALIRLTVEPALRDGLARRGLSHARRFSWERTAQETWLAYQEVLK